jgi:uncharacterized protein (TIGR00730 family)
MIDKSDAFLILPGGLGTLDELFEVWTGRQIKAHNKPIIIGNWDGYYDKLLSFLQQADHQGFLSVDHLDGITILNSVEDIVDTLKASLINTNTR